MSEPDPSAAIELGEPIDELPSIYPWLRWTVPVHALLPVSIAAAVSGFERGVEGLISWLWVLVHVGFPIVLVVSYPCWRGRGDQLALIVVINHAVTFAVGVALIAAWGP